MDGLKSSLFLFGYICNYLGRNTLVVISIVYSRRRKGGVEPTGFYSLSRFLLGMVLVTRITHIHKNACGLIDNYYFV